MLTGNEIREKFIEFFMQKQHKHFESASLIPDDPTLLLTVAGMVPFKPYFLGQKEAPCPRVTTYQKCIRTNDLENVGRTARHHTFFEMLGNFSFGDYFKKEAIKWSWEFVTEVLKLDKDKLWVTVFTTDDEAERIWIEECNFPKERIVRMGESENWWSAGPTGSCGPCSEIHVDLGVQYGGDENSKIGDEGTDNRFIEIWNLVFTEWNRMEDGSLEPLPKKNIDTGAGLERIAAVVQGKANNFETDLLFPILEEAAKITGSQYGKNPEIDFSLKVITDHARAVTFLVNDGVIPSNEGRGYILRRILRRAVRHGRLLGYTDLFMYKMVNKVVEKFEIAYPDLRKNLENIRKIVKIEEEKFSNTLDQGIQLVNQEIDNLLANGKNKLDGEVSFKLYDTYGFPYELTKDEGKLLSLREAKDGKYLLIFDKTPFYAESGGQVGDQGKIYSDSFEAKVLDVQKQKDIFIHTVEFEKGIAEENKTYKLEVDIVKRLDTAKNHTATHLLHKALREVVGTHVQQAGSLVDSEKLRFDFSHYEALTAEQLSKIEDIVNEKIREGIEVAVSHHSIEEAKNLGAMMLFGDKYGDVVRVVDVPGFSTELCGGTHIDNIGKIGLFKIVSEGGIAAGVRRIEAKTGYGAYLVEKEEADILNNIEKKLKATNINLVEKVEKTLETLKDTEKELETLKQKIALFETKAAISGMEEIGGAKVLIAAFKDKSTEDLRTMIDTIKDNNEKAIIVLASTQDKLSFAVGVTKTLTDKVKAGDLVKKLAEITGGKGGGRPDFAQAGGKDEGKLLDAFKEVREIIEAKLV